MSGNVPGRIPVRRALVSVSDKTGIAGLARRLHAAGVEIVSSGGTATAIAEAGVPVVPVADVTDAPEMLGGRVKTLHPAIHGGILAVPDDPGHAAELEGRGIDTFQLVVANLYPFEATVADPGVTDVEAVEQIDIGGPAMIRAAAKNHAHVAVVTDPADYDAVLEGVENGGIDDATRRRLAAAAFALTGAYDAAIAGWMQQDEPLPAHRLLVLERTGMLRYGENPHQDAALYRERGGRGWWDTATQLQGKDMSFNNYVDAEAAWRLVSALTGPAAVVAKHTNPCGAAVAGDVVTAFTNAWDCDPLSGFGSVVAVNRAVTRDVAEQIADRFIEVVIAPDVEPAAAALLAGRKNLRLLTATPPHGADLDLRRVEDGFVAQSRDVVDTGGTGMPYG